MALKANIPTVKLPEPMEVPDFSKSLASLMQAYSRMARMQAAASGSGGGTGPGSGKGYWVEYPNPADPSQPIRYWVEGDSTDIRKANLEQIQTQHARRVVSGDTQLREKLQNLDQYSAKKASEVLKDIRKNDLPRLSAASGVNVSSLLNEMLRPMQTNVNERLKAVKDDPWYNILGQRLASESKISLNDIMGFFSPNDARDDVAAGEERNRLRQEAENNSAYLREQALRQQEGEGFWSRSDGVGGLLMNAATAVAEAAPSTGIAIAAPIAGAALGGPVGFGAGLVAGGLANAPSSRGEYLSRVAADASLTDAQKSQAAEEGETAASLTGFGLGFIPLNLGRGLGAIANRIGGRVADFAADNVQRSGLSNLMRGTAITGLEAGVMSGTEMAAQNLIYGNVTGQDTPVLDNVWDAAVMGAIGGSPFGALRGFANRSPVAADQQVGTALALPVGNDQVNLPTFTTSPNGLVPSGDTQANLSTPIVTPNGLPTFDGSPTTYSTVQNGSMTGTVAPVVPLNSDSFAALPSGGQSTTRPIKMGTDEVVPSAPIEMGMAVPDTPEQRLYNTLSAINKNDKNAEASLKAAIQTYGQEGGTLDRLAVFAKQARLSNKNLAALPADQRLFTGSKLTNAPLRELADLIKLAETDDTILGVRPYGEEGSDTGSGQPPATPSVEPVGQQGPAATVGTDIVVDSGVATPIIAPAEGVAAAVVDTPVGGDRTVESGGIGGTPIQGEPASQILESIAQPEGTSPATDASVSGSDNRLATDSGTPTDQSTGGVVDQGGGSNDRPKNAANFSSEQQSTGETRVRRRIIVDAEVSPPSSDVRPAGVVNIGKKGVFDTVPNDATEASKRTARLIETLREVAENAGLDPIVPTKSSMAYVKKLEVTSSKSDKNNTSVTKATESDVLATVNSIDYRLVNSRQKEKIIEALYNEALGAKLSKSDAALLRNVRNEYDIPKIGEFADPDLSHGDSVDKLINSLPPKFWTDFIGKHIGSVGHVLNSIRNGLDTSDSPIIRELRNNYETIRSQAHTLQNIRIADSIAKSDSVYADVARKFLQSRGSLQSVKALEAARSYGLTDVDLPPNLDASISDARSNGVNVDPVLMARALMDPDSAQAKVLNQKFCPPV